MERIAEDIWAQRVKHRFVGLAVGTRVTIVKLADGLFVHSPIPLAPIRAEVDALGAVRHVVCPNLYHHLYAGEWAKAYPEAGLYGPKALHAKRSDLTFAGTLDRDWGGELVPIPIEGSILKETVFLHPKTRTLITSDLAENFPTMDDFFTRQYLRLNGTLGRVGWPRVLRVAYRDKAKAKASIARLLEHDFDRLILAHGEIIETGAKDAIRETFTFLGT
jgi:hypothetical protein